MNKKEYDREQEKWLKWAKEWERYTKRQNELVRKGVENADEILEKEFGKSSLEMYFGPWTKIYDKTDLANPNFILPGQNTSLLSMSHGQGVVNAFGKVVESSDLKIHGRVIGYAYDAGDDYLIIDTGGEEKYLILNCQYKILDEKEEDN